MADTKKYGEDIDGVKCEVTNCKYNTIDRCCSAGSIKVVSTKANTKDETHCSTFCPRGCC